MLKGAERNQDIWDFSWDALRCISMSQIRRDLGSWVSRSSADLCYSVFSSSWSHEHPLTTRLCPKKMWYSPSHLIPKAALKGWMLLSLFTLQVKPQRFKIKCPAHGHLVTQMVKNPPAMQEPRVWSLGQEDPLKKGMVSHSSILAWRIPRTEEPGGLYSP